MFIVYAHQGISKIVTNSAAKGPLLFRGYVQLEIFLNNTHYTEQLKLQSMLRSYFLIKIAGNNL